MCFSTKCFCVAAGMILIYVHTSHTHNNHRATLLRAAVLAIQLPTHSSDTDMAGWDALLRYLQLPGRLGLPGTIDGVFRSLVTGWCERVKVMCVCMCGYMYVCMYVCMYLND